jgi:hypothetical protein
LLLFGKFILDLKELWTVSVEFHIECKRLHFRVLLDWH